MFKVNNKENRTTPLARSGVFIVNSEHTSHLVFSFVNFEHVIAGWELAAFRKNKKIKQQKKTTS